MSGKYNIEELIIRYLQQDIKEEEMRELETWLQQSPENKAHLFQLKNIYDSRKYVRLSEKKELGWQKMYVRLNEKPEQNMAIILSGQNRILSSAWKYAAVILVALSVGWMIGEYGIKNIQSSTLQALAYNEIKVEKGSRVNTLILSDGSKVILNAATTFKYPTSFSANKREVYLDGEAYFEVAKDVSKPFIVKLKQQNIMVLGTSFNVEAYSDESYSITTLISGSISLEAFNEKGESMSRMFLKPNQRAVSDNQSGSVSLEKINISLAEAWTKGKYKFKDEPLSSIAKRLEKYYNVQVKIESESLGQMKYTGTFSLNQDLQDVLRILDHEKQYSIKRVENEIFISKK